MLATTGASAAYLASAFVPCMRLSEEGMIRLETLIELKCFEIRAFRAQIYQFELFELILLLKLDKQFPVEQFEASRAIRGSSISVSSTLPPLLV